MSDLTSDNAVRSRSPRPRRVLTPRNLAAVGVAVATAALLVILVPGRACGCASKLEIAEATLRRYVQEAYPQWAQQHPTQPCPPDLDALNAYMNGSSKDPWGRHYELTCDASAAPPDRLRILSFGPDSVRGTDDDLRSWK